MNLNLFSCINNLIDHNSGNFFLPPASSNPQDDSSHNLLIEEEGLIKLLKQKPNRITGTTKKNLALLLEQDSQPNQAKEKACLQALKFLIKNKCDLQNHDLYQKRALNAHNFTNWSLSRKLCCDEQIKKNCELLYRLKAQKTRSNEITKNTIQPDYEYELLKHLFNSAVQNLSDTEKMQIVNLKRSYSANNQIIQNLDSNQKAWVFAEKIINNLAHIFNSHAFQLTVGLGVFMGAGYGAYQAAFYLKDAAVFHGLPVLINYAPLSVIHAISSIYSNIFYIWAGATLLSFTNPSSTIDKWVFKPVRGLSGLITYFPLVSLKFAVNTGLKLATYANFRSKTAGNNTETFQRKWTDLRLGHELVEARELWIKSMREERLAYRKSLGS